MSVEQLPDTPGRPEVRRHIRLYPYQWVGLTLLPVIPVLAGPACSARLGAGRGWRAAEGGGAGVMVEYPHRLC